MRRAEQVLTAAQRERLRDLTDDPTGFVRAAVDDAIAASEFRTVRAGIDRGLASLRYFRGGSQEKSSVI